MMASSKHWRIGAVAGVALLAIVGSSAPDALAAHTLKATDTAHLRYVSAAGSLLSEEGSASGTLPGKMRASVNVGATISGNFTISTQGGTIKGHGSATPHGSGTFESFAGSIIVTGGTGRFANAHGHTGLYGTFNRSTYALTVQTTGTLSY
jgi:formylmethanofuran dehydrogenase subunit C